MVCNHCRAELPAGAFFCGECGRAVTTGQTSRQRKTPKLFRRDPIAPVFRPAAATPDQELSGAQCSQCGAPLGRHEVFCGECGFAVPQPKRNRQVPTLAPLSAQQPPIRHPPGEPPPGEPPPGEPPPGQPPPGRLPPLHRPTGEASVQQGATEAGAAGRSAAESGAAEDGEITTIVSPGGSDGERFVLQFSTGESITVFGSGLVGRNPRAEPGENFATIIGINDPTRSVSKTHLEFGQTEGRFWISDRFSGNGSTVRARDGAVVNCIPGRRQLLARGSRVDIGEQFFDLS